MSEILNPQTPLPQNSTRAKTAFEEFLLAEYSNIAQAHFNTVNSISEFFKHYIVIVSLPISVAVIFLKPAEEGTSGLLGFLLKEYPLVPTMLLVLVALIGLSVLGYVINLRFDAILYARTVNGIRKYFSDSSAQDGKEVTRFLGLPTSMHFPLYIETGYFLFVVLTFTIVGTSYLTGGLYLYWQASNWAVDVTFWFLAGLCAWLHLFLYAFLGWKRDRGYVRGPIIGVDIDGVLNDHRRHFTTVLKDQTGKDLDPKLITEIPVHTIPHTNVKKKDEHAVFNWPSYWTDMPPLEGAADCIKRLRNAFGCRIWIFTHRDWPQPKSYPIGREDDYRNAWKQASSWRMPIIGSEQIKTITKQWLRQHGFKYDRLIVERINTEATDGPIFTRNRFWASKNIKIRAFIEDDISKAKKLADICSIVFLIDHPYNQMNSDELPSNILRVESWQEVYELLKQVF